MHIVIDIVNILFDKYIYSYATMCKTGSRPVKRKR